MAESVVLDACTVIILEGCGALDAVLSLEEYQFQIGPIVLKECGSGCQATLDQHMRGGRLSLVPIEAIPTALFLHLLQRYRLGDGETECLVICEALGCSIATDDMAARRAATALYGATRLTGTLGLLRAAVALGRLTSSAAMEFYNIARRRGAFLPDVDAGFFSQ